MSLPRHQHNLCLECLVLTILLISLLMLLALVLVIQDSILGVLPRKPQPRRWLVPLRLSQPARSVAFWTLGSGLGLAALVSLAVRRYWVRPEPPPWE